MALVILAARCIIACLFIRAGVAKIVSLTDFRAAVTNYQLLPARLVSPVALSLPFAEVGAAILLAAGILPTVVAGFLTLLLLIFALAIGINLARGRVFNCGCAGAAPQEIGWTHVASNTAMAAVAIAVAIAPPRTLVVWPGVAGPFPVTTPRADALPVVLAVVLCLVMVTVLRRASSVRALAERFPREADAVPVSTDSRRY